VIYYEVASSEASEREGGLSRNVSEAGDEEVHDPQQKLLLET
jgi:hypothetical protein